MTHNEIARRLAVLKGDEYAGEFDPSRRYGRPLYFVPTDTLIATGSVPAIHITSEHDLFGGMVPFPFVATKTITHGLVDQHGYAPPGWSSGFCRLVQGKVLPGYSAFTSADVRYAAARLLEHGSVRIKKPCASGGLGQAVMTDMDEVDAFLATLAEADLLHDGVVLETNLNNVVTYSVGQVKVGELLATYCGTQQLTASNHGEQVYGGSALTVIRGDFDALLDLELETPVRTAIDQARAYHAAAFASYPGMLASRANYDVAQGTDEAGRWHSGVLEQSWRIGGASAAEVAALMAFQADKALNVVRASTTEIYGGDPAVPQGALFHYRGIDERAGPLTKFSMLEFIS